jgi:hypothetical protein
VGDLFFCGFLLDSFAASTLAVLTVLVSLCSREPLFSTHRFETHHVPLVIDQELRPSRAVPAFLG